MSILPKLFGKKKSGTASVERPHSGAVQISGKMADRAALVRELKSISVFSDVDSSGSGVSAMVVESTDRNKKPHLYMKLSFSEKEVEVFYSIPPELPNPTLRRLNIMRSLFTSLSILEARGAFLPERAELYTRTMEAFDLGLEFADTDMLKLKYDYERAVSENSAMRDELMKLKEEKEGLNHGILSLEKRCQTLEDRLAKLESPTDSELDREIVRWVEDHNGRLNEQKFCASFNIGAQRLEERLDALSKSGVIRIV